MASSSSSSSQSCKYDVFLSFRGEDTRKTFIDHLYSALVQKTILTFKDDKSLRRGEFIDSSLFTAINSSRISVIVFSKNYAKSWWCLEELTHIMKCKDERGLSVMPIFYDVDPSELRKQEREVGEALARHEIKNATAKVESWRKALVDAGNIVGWEPKNIANGHESELIKEIVDEIFHRLFPSNFSDDEGLVGMRTRLKDVRSLLEIESDCVRMVGIWGLGGSGKTTLATSVYKEISHLFEGSCIVENIRERSSKHGFEILQKNILSAVFHKDVPVYSITDGKHLLKSMLYYRKVLVVLDDVDELEQLEALAGSHEWFGSGSRIIITTRDEHLLRTHKVDEVCRVRLLADDEATILFNKHAYNVKEPINDYKTLSLRVVSYAARLPLALKVLGSFLYDKNKNEWMSVLERLKDIPEKKILEKLRLSYDGLETEEKQLFLDIACFFRGESADCTGEAMEILEACGFHPQRGIKVLRQKALITINVEGNFDMHDLVQEMGDYIVRVEHPNSRVWKAKEEFGGYLVREEHPNSRVWKAEEIRNLSFRDATMIEALRYHADFLEHPSHFCEVVSNMKKLRWLSVTFSMDYISRKEYDGGPNSFFRNFLRKIMKDDRGPSFLSNNLRYLHWEGYPASSFPESFQPVNLFVLKLDNGLQKNLWRGNKLLPHLKVLELGYMKNLVSTPNFKELSCLQKLKLVDCEKLEEIHPSLGQHTSLEYVIVSSCMKLKMFPRIIDMEKLKTLQIYYCYEIREFPEIEAGMESLVNLSLWSSCIEVLPSSIGEHCTNLTSLRLYGLEKSSSIEFSLDGLKNLKRLEYSYCHLEDVENLSEVGELCNIEELDLSGNDFSLLDFSLLQLTRLRLLKLNHSKRLVEFPELPSSVAILEAYGCDSLRAVGGFNRNCKWLCQVSIVNGGIINDGGRLLESMLQGEAIETTGSIVLALEGLEIPRGLTPGVHKGDTFRLKLPENWSNDFWGFLMCAVLEFSDGMRNVEISMKQVMSGMIDDEVVWEESDGERVTWVGYVSFASLRHTCWWDPTFNNLSFSISYRDFWGKKCSGFGVRLGGWTSSQTDPSDSSQFPPDFHIKHDLMATTPLDITRDSKLGSMGGSDPTDSSQLPRAFDIIHDSRNSLRIRSRQIPRPRIV